MKRWRPNSTRKSCSSRSRTARVGSRSLKDRRHRQPADGDPGRAGQGRQGPLGHALSTAPEDSTHLLAARPSEAMAVSWPRRPASARTQRLARGLPFSLRGGWLEQAGDGAHAAAHIRDPSLGERGGRASRSCSATPASQARRATHGSPPKRSATRRVASAWRSYRPAEPASWLRPWRWRISATAQRFDRCTPAISGASSGAL